MGFASICNGQSTYYVPQRPAMFSKTALLLVISVLSHISEVALGSPTLEARQSADNIVYVTNAAAFWYVSSMSTRSKGVRSDAG